jgi:uncharacterized protein YbjT (DUF2867 family)
MNNKTKIRVIITGVTGMVGEGVLHECLQCPQVEQILVVNRKPCGIEHPKLVEVIHQDFFNLSSIEGHLYGYNACFFCLGVSSVGMKEPEYTKITYTLTLNFARTLAKLNYDMTFCYVSGASTDSTEKGKMMWARVKGKTENDLTKLLSDHVYNFRPGFMQPTPGLKNTLPYYKYLNWLYPVVKKVFPKLASTLAEVGQAMINTMLVGYDQPILEVKDIVALAHARD